MKPSLKSLIFYILFVISFVISCYSAFPKNYYGTMNQIAEFLIYLIPYIIGTIGSFISLFFLHKNYKLINNKKTYIIYLVFTILIVGGLYAFYIEVTHSFNYYQTIIGYVSESLALVWLLYILIKPFTKKEN
ncbi:MAG: hypothetical protein V8R16_01645 [Bacilli bacterium]